MEDIKGGNTGADVSAVKFEVPTFPNPLFAIGTNGYTQQSVSLPSTSRASTSKKPTSPKRIPRPMNAFMIFSNENRTEMRKRFPLLQNKELSKRLGAVWRKLNKEEQDVYYRKAKLASEDHRRKYPDYHYRPRGRGPNAPDKLNKNLNKNVAGAMPFVAVQSPGGLLAAASLNSLQSPSMAPSFVDVSHLQAIEAPPNHQVAQSAVAVRGNNNNNNNSNASAATNNNNNNSRRPRNRVSNQLTLPNMGAQEGLKPANLFGEGSASNALTAVTNFYQQYLAYGPGDYNQLAAAGKTLAVPTAMLTDGSTRVPGPAHSSSSNNCSYKQMYTGDSANLQVARASWLPSLTLGANVPYAAHQSFPVFLLNQQGKSVPANHYLQNVAWRQQNMPSGFDSYLRLASNVGDPNHVQSISGTSNGGYQAYLTPPPSHAGSTSSVSSPPFSAESSQSNCSSSIQLQNEASFSGASQHSLPTPLPSQYAGGSSSQSSRLFFPSTSQVHEGDGRQSCQIADLSTEADERTTNYGSWDTSNMEPMSYESSITPGFYSEGGIGNSQQNHSGESGFLMGELDEEHANEAVVNMSSNGYNNYTSSANNEPWTGGPQALYMGQQISQHQLVYAASPLALNQNRPANNSRQLSSDLRAFPDETLSQEPSTSASSNNSSIIQNGNMLNFGGNNGKSSFSDPAYGEAFSVSTAASSADDLDDQTCDFEDDRLLNFNFPCNDTNVPVAACVNDMLSTESYGNFVESSGTSRWDFHDDLNDVEPTAANSVADNYGTQVSQPSASSPHSAAECALLEAAGL